MLPLPLSRHEAPAFAPFSPLSRGPASVPPARVGDFDSVPGQDISKVRWWSRRCPRRAWIKPSIPSSSWKVCSPAAIQPTPVFPSNPPKLRPPLESWTLAFPMAGFAISRCFLPCAKREQNPLPSCLAGADTRKAPAGHDGGVGRPLVPASRACSSSWLRWTLSCAPTPPAPAHCRPFALSRSHSHAFLTSLAHTSAVLLTVLCVCCSPLLL